MANRSTRYLPPRRLVCRFAALALGAAGHGIMADGWAFPQYKSSLFSGLSYAVAMNDSGVVAGSVTVGGEQHLAIWQDGVVTPLAVSIPGKSIVWTTAVDINAKGQVLGRAHENNGAPYDFFFVWDAGTAHELPCPLDGCSADSIDDSGTVAGKTWRTADVPQPQATIWQAYVPTLVSSLPGGEASTSAGISPSGIVFGQRTGGNGFYWQNGVTTPIPVPAASDPFWLGAYYSPITVELKTGNSSRVFVGTIGMQGFGFVWRNGNYQRLRDFPLSDFTSATMVRTWPSAIDDSGGVVGTIMAMYETPLPFGVDGFVWNETEGTARMSTLVQAHDPLKRASLQLLDANNHKSILASYVIPGVGVGGAGHAILTPLFRYDNDLLIDFGPAYGLWSYRNDSLWSQVQPGSARLLARGDLDDDGISDVLVDFGPPYGLWAWRNGTTWQQAHSGSARQIVAGDLDNNGSTDFVIDFGPPYGLWAWMNGTSWKYLHASPRQVIAANLDADPRRDLVVDFGAPYGIWAYLNDSTWTQLHSGTALDMVAGDFDGNGIDVVAINFGGQYGLWLYRNGGWTQLHTGSPVRMVVGNFDADARKDLVADFGGPYGIWMWKNATNWQYVRSGATRLMAVADLDRNGIDELVVDFGPPYGLWVSRNGGGWSYLHNGSPTRVIAADIDGQ